MNKPIRYWVEKEHYWWHEKSGRWFKEIKRGEAFSSCRHFKTKKKAFEHANRLRGSKILVSEFTPSKKPGRYYTQTWEKEGK